MGLRKLFKERSNKSGPDEDGTHKKSKRPEESLQEIQGRYRKLLNHTQAIQYTHDLQGQFLSVDQEITEFLGYDRNSLLNMNIRALLASEVRHKFETYLGEIKRQGVTKGLMVVQTASGEKRILKYYNTLRTEGVAIPFVQGIAYDVTEQKQTRKTLKQLSEQLSIILKSLPIVCYICKAEEDYGATYITHNVKAITGFEQTDFTSKSFFWANRIHPEDAPKIFADFPQIFEKGYHEHQYRWQVADGSYKWFYDYTRLIKSSDGRNYIIGMMQDITERKRAEEALLHAAQQWRTTFDGINDFVCLLDLEGKILRCNKAMRDFLGKPFNEIINHSCWEVMLGATTPIEDCPFLRMKETLHRETTILSVNGLSFNISIDPIFDQAGRLIGAVNIISDITKRKQAEESVAKLSQENAIMAEIGQIISSTLDIDEVYERFSEQVRKLISFDRIEIVMINLQDHSISLSYITGLDVPNRKAGGTIPMSGTAVEEVFRTRSSLLIQPLNMEESATQFPPLLSSFQAGLRSMIFVPLFSENRVIGALSLKTTRPDFYTERDLRLAERVGNQIVGAIANAQLFIDRKRAEESAAKFSQENAIMAEIGLIISSTLNIDEVYERFSEQVRQLIPFDRISVNLINPNRTSITIAYTFGIEVGDLPKGTVVPLDAPFSENILSKRQGVLILPEDESELAKSYPNLVKHFRTGIRSMMTVPLISKDQVIGLLHFQSLKLNSYTESDLKLAERVGNQIAGAVANSQLFIERKRAEEAAARLAQENAVMAEIGRVISSTLNIDEVYERFAEEVRKLIPFDRIMINIVNLENNTTSFAYIAGIDVQGRRVGDITPLKGTATFECVRTRSSMLIQPENVEECLARFPALLPTFQAGLQSIIFVPLISKDHVIGALSFRSTKAGAYTDRDLKLAENIGAQIAGAIANAELYTERKRAEEAVNRLSQENAVMAEIGRIISSTLNIEEVYERFAEEVRKLIPFDRISLSSINPDGRSATITYIWGPEVKNRNRGDVFPLKGTLVEMALTRRCGFLVLMETEEAVAQIHPTLLNTFRAGFRSLLSVPLISKDQMTGILILHASKENAYTELDLKLAERVGNQIAGAIANAQLFIERKRAEEALKRSGETARRLAQENAVMAEIGRVISSTLNIEEVYERFAEEVRKLIPFDRIAVTTINLKDHSGSVAYAWGAEVAHRKRNEVFPIKGLFYEKLIATRAGILVQTEDEKELAERYPGLRGIIHGGFRSMISVPLISKDEVIGVLHVRSLKSNAYTESDLKLVERVGNQIAGTIANASLYAERKHMGEALRKSEERFRDLYDHAPLGYHEYDAKGIITNVNRTDLEMLGYTAEEMIGHPMWEFNIEGEIVREQILAKLAGTVLPGRNLERTYRKKDGATIPVLVEDRLILDEKGQIKGIRCTIQDITERKRAEEERLALQEQLRQSQKMEAIGKLAGGVAHDFNNLLTVIQGYGELLLHSLDQDSRLRQDVQEIINASGRASSLTRQLLAFSRKQVLQPKVLDLNVHVSDMDKMLRRMIGEDIELVTLLAEDLGRIKADPGQIEQMILNLAVNAKDAMLTGGKLTIETANVKLDENYARSRIGVTPGDYVMLSMSDTGAGMKPETKERIFEPFFTTKEKGKGTGLGLSTVYGIVQQSGGNIWVYSEPGLGTTFKIYLPTIEGDTESLRPAPIPTRLLQGSETVLLVEDEEMVRKLACTVLEKNGYTVLEASNGDEALDVVQGRNGNPIRLVVTDVVMPGMSGRQLADRLVSLRPELKVLYMSGYTDDAIVHHGVLDPGIAYIQKPFTPDAFASKVREILDGN